MKYFLYSFVAVSEYKNLIKENWVIKLDIITDFYVPTFSFYLSCNIMGNSDFETTKTIKDAVKKKIAENTGGRGVKKSPF